MQPRPELINPTLDWLASLDAQDFKRYFKGSPLERTGRKRLLRNVAIAMGNSHDCRFLPQLDAWITQTTDETLRETAEWARAQITESVAARSAQ
jgi:epoxyqueuosine reductase